MILVVQKINFINLILICILKIFFKKIFFFNSSVNLRSKTFFYFLKKINIIWVSYEDFYVKNHTIIKRKAISFSQSFATELSEKLWIDNFEDNFFSKKQFSMLINNLLLSFSEKYFEYKKFAEEYVDEGQKIFLVMNNNFVTKRIFKNTRFVNLNIFDFTFLKFFIKSPNIFLKKKNLKKNESNNFGKKVKEFKNFKVIFFPHKGINPGYLIKDYYYSKKNTFLNSNNILHIEWNLNEVDDHSKKYYEDNDIPVIEWGEIKSDPISKFIFDKKLILFFFKTILNCGIILSFSVILETLKTIIAKNKIIRFKEANLFLVGYEYLFPTYLNIAIKNANKKIITVRDRRLLDKLGFESNYDMYFTTYRSNLPNTEYIGNIRLRNFSMDKNINLQNEKKKLKKINCLVLIDPSMEDWYTNGRHLRLNYKNNIKCLEDILSVSKRKKEINFFIKCKNNKWETLKIFSKTLGEIKETNNLEILNNHQWQPDKGIRYFDFAIGRYTSLMDDLVFLGKPVIVFDDDLYPYDYLKINRELFAKDQKELINKIEELLSNPDSYISKMNEWKEEVNSIFNKNKFEKKLVSFL
jgi:hypothetical protein